MADRKVTAVIPALNEERTLPGVLAALKPYTDEIIVVDDGSGDRTAQLARQGQAVVLSHSIRKGYDRSIDDGFALAAERGATVIFTFDADGQHVASDIPGIVGPILEGRADVVVGRRPRHARVAEHLFALLSRRMAGVDDPLCGMKAYSVEVYRDVGYFDRISSIGTQLTFSAKKRGYRVAQRDITVRKRADVPRFGRRLKANWKILLAIASTIVHRGDLT
jgi:glycosyltransferase involved in cell wall biosynthesis